MESLWGASGTGTLTLWAQMPSLYDLLCVHGQSCSCAAVPLSGAPDRESIGKAGMRIPCLPAKLLRIHLHRKIIMIFFVEIKLKTFCHSLSDKHTSCQLLVDRWGSKDSGVMHRAWPFGLYICDDAICITDHLKKNKHVAHYTVII